MSRGGAVSLFAGALALAVLRRLHTARGRRAGCRAPSSSPWVPSSRVALVAALPGEGRERLLTLAGIGGDVSGVFRLRTWADTLRQWTRSPLLGYGFGGFADAHTRFKSGGGDLRIEHAESDYLQVLAEGGVVSLALTAASIAGGRGSGPRPEAAAPPRAARDRNRCGRRGGRARRPHRVRLQPPHPFERGALLLYRGARPGRERPRGRRVALDDIGPGCIGCSVLMLLARTPLAPAPLPRGDLETAAAIPIPRAPGCASTWPRRG